VRVVFKRYPGKSAHVIVCREWDAPREEAARALRLLYEWSIVSHKRNSVVLHRKDVPVAAAVLRLQGYEVEIES